MNLHSTFHFLVIYLPMKFQNNNLQGYGDTLLAKVFRTDGQAQVRTEAISINNTATLDINSCLLGHNCIFWTLQIVRFAIYLLIMLLGIWDEAKCVVQGFGCINCSDDQYVCRRRSAWTRLTGDIMQYILGNCNDSTIHRQITVV